MGNIPGVRDSKHAPDTVGFRKLTLVDAGGAQHLPPQLDGVQVAQDVQVDAATGMKSNTE